MLFPLNGCHWKILHTLSSIKQNENSATASQSMNGDVHNFYRKHQAGFLGYAQQPAVVLFLAKIYKKLASIRRIDCLLCY